MILSGKAGEQQLINIYRKGSFVVAFQSWRPKTKKKEQNVGNTRTNLSFTDFNLDT